MPKLADRNKCTGCTACVNICLQKSITAEKDVDGFTYPVISNPEGCVNCGACEKVCPVAKNDAPEKNEETTAYAAISRNETLRMQSSSGGVFTELAKRIISQNGVVYGAAYDDEWNVRHIAVDDAEQLGKLRGAKYSESCLGTVFVEIKEQLRQGREVLFSGTPCQVAGLKSFLRKDYENLFCVDFVCHGVPSPTAWQSYVKYRAEMDACGEFPCNVNLRSKDTGWSKYQYSNVFEYTNGNRHSIKSSQSLFMKLFVGDFISRKSCSDCNFKGYSRVSDITLGDFWGIWDIAPEMDDDKGTSVILLQSEKGKRLWEEIKGKLKYRQVTLEQASRYNSSMISSSKAKQNREAILDRIRSGQIASCEELFIMKLPSFYDRVKRKITGMVRRIFGKH